MEKQKLETQYQTAMRILDSIVMEWKQDPNSMGFIDPDVAKEAIEFMIQYHGEERYKLNNPNN